MREDLYAARRPSSEGPRLAVHEEVDVLDLNTARAVDIHLDADRPADLDRSPMARQRHSLTVDSHVDGELRQRRRPSTLTRVAWCPGRASGQRQEDAANQQGDAALHTLGV